MFSLSRLRNFFWSPGPEAKVAIIGLGGVGKYTLLQRLSEVEIQTVEWPVMKLADVKLGKSHRWNMNLVQTYVGCSEKPSHKKWVADQFCDSDGIIFVITDDGCTPEAAEWMGCYARGFKPPRGPSYFLKVREGVPWLILGNKKVENSPSMTVEEIRRTMELDSLDIDSHIEVVNILTGEGVDEAISWLRKRINTPKEERFPMKEVKERQDGKQLFS